MTTNPEKIPFWRDSRFLKVLFQSVLLLVILVIFLVLGNNLVNNFRRLGLNFGWSFLFDPDIPSRFGIGDSPIPYSSTDPYSRAILVGLLNSLRIMISGIILAFILGVTIGLGRLSDNWLVRQIATVYVETLRNTPLLLQLFFWYFAVFLKLPKIDNPAIFLNSIFLSNQGLYLPFPSGSLQTWFAIAFLILSCILAMMIWGRKTQVMGQQGETGNIYQVMLIGIAIAAILNLAIGLNWQFPQYDPQLKSIKGGLSFSPEFSTLLVGLTVYTAAFIAEVIRAGIQSISKGQWEAARALGLNSGLGMRLVIFPQALPVIIPPLTSEFLNLAKNSSLAIAIGYSDIYAVSSTISNQTGKAIEMLLVIITTYLIFNLVISTGMNWFNQLVKIKEK